MLNRDLQFAYRTFAQNMLTSCGNNPKVADIPIQVNLNFPELFINIYLLK